MVEVREPTTAEFDQYFDLRYRVLREPYGQPVGTERDHLDLENRAIHAVAVENGTVVSCGRLHFNSPTEGQIRYMATERSHRGRGIGGSVLGFLEQKARDHGVRTMVLNARDEFLSFYSKAGYVVVGVGPVLFGSVKHSKMEKEL